VSSTSGTAGYPGDDGPLDDTVAVGEVVEDVLSSASAEEMADRVDVDLDLAAAEAEDLGQSAEEAVVEAVEFAQRVETERDELRDLVQRVKADFDNYKRRVEVQRAEQRALAAVELVRDLLPVLDACDAALAQGHTDVAPVQSQLESTLAKRGLVKVSDTDVEFDPNVHEAVMHEEGDGDAVVVEVLRAGYLWNDHVVRPAMVKVKG
jgi:molecular chaperone GrpE